MQKKLGLVISLAFVIYFVDSKPGFVDDLDADLTHLAYEVEEEDLDDIGKILDYSDDSAEDKTSKTSGFKKERTGSKGVKGKKKIEDEKKIYKIGAAHDDGSYDDDEIYGEAEGVAGQAVGVTGKEDRKYRKGTKTRGFHRVSHKDEYKKDKVFYEDDETKGALNKVGAKGQGYLIGAGAGFSKGHFHHDHKKGVFGKRGYQDNGSVNKEVKGYTKSEGFDESF